jgi:hypothetical protein
MSFRESVTALNDQADAARQAIQAMIAVAGNDPESQRARRLLAQRSYEVAAKRHREMKRQLRGNPSAVAGLPPKPSRSSFTSRLPDEGTEWAAAEFERRCSALTGMLQFADTLPLHLLTAERGAAHSAVPGLQSERAAEVLATLSEAARWQSRPA